MSSGDHQHVEEVVCREFVELVTDYWEGSLPEDRIELVEEHLVMCDWCVTYLDQLGETVRALPGAAQAQAVPERTEDALQAAFRERMRPG